MKKIGDKSMKKVGAKIDGKIGGKIGGKLRKSKSETDQHLTWVGARDTCVSKK